MHHITVEIDKDLEIQQSLKDWQQIIRSYQKPHTGKAIVQILNSFIPFLLLWGLMYMSISWSIWLTVVLGCINSFFLVRIFIIQHDCGHQSFLKSKKWNNAIGTFCSIFTSIPYTYWAKVHGFHHGHTGQLEYRDIGDIDFLTVSEYKELSKWGRIKYRVFRNPIVLFCFAPIIYVVFSNRFPLVGFKGWKKTHRSQLINNLAILVVYATLTFLLGWQFLFVHFLLVVLFSIIAFWFFYVQHQHEEAYKQWRENWNFLVAAIKGSTFYRLPKLFHWLTGNIGFHHIHHLSPRIPNYYLPKCAHENPILQKYVTQINFWESLSCMFNKLWDEETQRMISFKEFYKREDKEVMVIKA